MEFSFGVKRGSIIKGLEDMEKHKKLILGETSYSVLVKVIFIPLLD
jgi:hypothetical protein